MKFPGLSELLGATPKNGTVCGYVKDALVYEWSETERRWVQKDVEPTHYLKLPGEDWKALP